VGDTSRAGRAGRRPGRQDTRGAILAAARTSFAARGFAGTTLREIAGAAEVDPALIHHYFDSKRTLFLATVRLPVDPPALLAEVRRGDRRTMGPRLVARVLEVWESEHRAGLVAALRTALGDPAMARPLQEFLSSEVIDQILGDLTPDAEESRRRAGLVASSILGLLVGRYVLELPALAQQTRDEVVAAVGPVVQRYLDGDVDRAEDGAAGVLAAERSGEGR
jgi:AcrR family transcriptional regulator